MSSKTIKRQAERVFENTNSVPERNTGGLTDVINRSLQQGYQNYLDSLRSPQERYDLDR